MSASSSKSKSKRTLRYKGRKEDYYVPEYDTIPPIIPAPRQVIRGWDPNEAAIMSLAERKNWFCDFKVHTWVNGLTGTNPWRWGSWNQMCLLSGLTQGDTETSRVGRKIKVVNIDLCMAMLCYQEAGASCFSRTIILLDTQTNGEGPNINWKGNSTEDTSGGSPRSFVRTGKEVFEPTLRTSSTLSCQWLMSPMNEANKRRYIVLKDIWMINDPKTGLTTGSNAQKACHIKESIKCDIDITYSDNTGNVSGMTSNSLWILTGFYGWESTVATAQPATEVTVS